MSRPLAGKRYFEAMGRSDYARGLSLSYGRQGRMKWPMWARTAWAAGWLMQGQRNF